jgi:hypothetical protein
MHFMFISSIRVEPGPRNRGPTSLLALKIRTPVANTGKLRSIVVMTRGGKEHFLQCNITLQINRIIVIN